MNKIKEQLDDYAEAVTRRAQGKGTLGEVLDARSAVQGAIKDALNAKDTAALIEIDRVMLESGADWPDLEGDALVVRHVKELTRMLNAERAAVQALRDQVRLAYVSGTTDWRRFYDKQLFAVIGVTGFRDLFAPAGSVEAPL
jgi:hypothetical protein